MKFLQGLLLGFALLAKAVGAQTTVSHQQLATEWLISSKYEIPGGDSVSGPIRYALACLYFATNNVANDYTPAQKWKFSQKWLSDFSVCEWYGVECDDEGLPRKIVLANNDMGGFFPQELTILGGGLVHLDLRNNPIESNDGDLSWIASMTKLEYLDLYFCNMDYFGIPPYFKELTNLRHLDISYCFFYGEIDGEPLADLAQLTYLDIGGNYFYANALPSEIAKLPNLEVLLLDYTGLQGDLSWFQYVNPGIFELWADDNNFDGSIPETIGGLYNLASLSLTSCTLTGTLPTELGNLTAMEQMWFYNNSLVGEIPTEIGELTVLVTFQTEDNMLEGTMPSQVCDIGNNVLKQLSTDCDTKNGNAQVECKCCKCCASPCFPDPPPGLGGFCFPGNSLVEVMGKGTQRMEHLQIGDNVHIGNDKFSEVYGFGHYSQQVMGEYLQLFGSNLDLPLEITEDHMLFIEERGAVPARNVKIGDQLVLVDGTTSTVNKIATVTRVGAYAPFTHSGTIAVNDVVASSYVSLQEGAEYLMAGDVKIANMHWLAHVLQAPHRIVCHLSSKLCAKETYTQDGVSNWVYRPLLAAQWLVEQNAAVIAVLSIPVLLLAGICVLVEALVMNAGLVALAVAGFALVQRRAGVSQKSA